MASVLDQSTKHPLMVVIDELDRCRPSYAVSLIEVAKHIFGADHIIFVLAVNRTQLQHSIRALYGNEFDATGYLRRFFDIDFRLPEPNRTRFMQDLLHRAQVGRNVELLQEFCGSSDFSLRQVGQVIHHFGLAAASLQNGPTHLRTTRDVLAKLTEVALIVRAIDTDLYRRFARDDLSDQYLVDAIYQRVSIRDAHFEAFIIMAAKEITSYNKSREYDPQIESPLIDRYKKQEGGHGERVIKCVQEYENTGYSSISMTGPGFLYAVRLIELLADGTNIREWCPIGLPSSSWYRAGGGRRGSTPSTNCAPDRSRPRTAACWPMPRPAPSSASAATPAPAGSTCRSDVRCPAVFQLTGLSGNPEAWRSSSTASGCCSPAPPTSPNGCSARAAT